MLADYHVLARLIERHGTPRIVVPNTPYCQYTKPGSGSVFLGDNPPAGLGPLNARVLYCRIPLGDAPYLQIRAYVELEARAIAAAGARLQAMGIVELRREGTLRGPRGGAKPVIRIAVREDTAPLPAHEFQGAVAERRVLLIQAERFMGDAYLRLNVATSPDLNKSSALCWLFAPPCRLTDAELAYDPSEGSLESVTDVIDHFRQRLTRPLPAPSTGR